MFSSIAGLTSGPGGNLWFTEQENSYTTGQKPAVGEITPSGVTQLYPLPQETTLDPNLGVQTDPSVIIAEDGTLWFGENGAIGQITTSGTIQQYSLSTPWASVEALATGPDGSVWFLQNDENTSYSIGRITTADKILMYPLSPNCDSAFITAGPDGTVWFTETLTNAVTSKSEFAVGRITAKGQMHMFALPQTGQKYANLGNITEGSDGNLWFTLGDDIGHITAKGKVKMIHVFSTSNKAYGSYPPAPPNDITAGPNGNLWYRGTIHDKTGIAQISTSGKLGSVIPASDIVSNLVRVPDGQVRFVTEAVSDVSPIGLGIATRSGILVTQDLPASSSIFLYPNSNSGGVASGLAVGPDGNLWATSGPSSIIRISGLDTVAGGLDYRRRPRRAPDFSYDQWTNVTDSARPAFAGIAKPGAKVTLWAQMQGSDQPVSIGQVKASQKTGTWTLTSRVRLKNGYYAVTASQTGDTGPASVLYSLAPDSYGDLSNCARHFHVANQEGNWRAFPETTIGTGASAWQACRLRKAVSCQPYRCLLIDVGIGSRHIGRACSPGDQVDIEELFDAGVKFQEPDHLARRQIDDRHTALQATAVRRDWHAAEC